MRRRATLLLGLGAAILIAAALGSTITSGHGQYEVWAIDQSDSPGKAYGGALYIWDSSDVERRKGVGPHDAEHIDLGDDASTLCMERTGAYPVRPHMITVNPSQTHAIVSFVASGHVLFIEGSSRRMVECIRTSVGAGGARQVHMSTPSPDETYVAVANQNGKLFERIRTNYRRNRFVLETAATLDLANCTTPNGDACQSMLLRPDNAPICPIIESTGQFSFVTLRGGGLFVVDSRATPMRIVAEYDQDVVHGNGCLGAEASGKMYVDSGGGTAANLYQADLYAFPLDEFSSSPNPRNSPAPSIVFNESHMEHADAHGATVARQDKYLWVADRGRNFLWVVDTRQDRVVNRIDLINDLSEDPTPDLLSVSPDGSHVYISLRGPVPLTADPHVSTGSTPGLGILKVTAGGRSARFESIARVSNIGTDGRERADVHASTVRMKVRPKRW